jgi:hypothetical protein
LFEIDFKQRSIKFTNKNSLSKMLKTDLNNSFINESTNFL